MLSAFSSVELFLSAAVAADRQSLHHWLQPLQVNVNMLGLLFMFLSTLFESVRLVRLTSPRPLSYCCVCCCRCCWSCQRCYSLYAWVCGCDPSASTVETSPVGNTSALRENGSCTCSCPPCLLKVMTQLLLTGLKFHPSECIQRPLSCLYMPAGLLLADVTLPMRH